MTRWKARLPKSILLVALTIIVTGGTAVSEPPNILEELPPEYDLMQGIIVAWLPWGPIPDGPITELSTEEIVTLNELSVAQANENGYKLKPAYNKFMAEKIKLKKGAGSPDTDGLDIDVYPYHYMMLDLVKAIIDSGATAHIVTASEPFRNQLNDFMAACGFKQHDFNKIEFHYYGLNSIWVRDYGPWITEDRNRLAVVDNAYYPGRPADDYFPEFFSTIYGLPLTDFEQIQTEGGNILTDGLGRGFTTQAILAENPGLSMEDAKALFENVLNLDELIFLPGDLSADLDEIIAALGGTGHVDMGLKLLSDTKVLIGDFVPGTFGKGLLDSWADWFNSHTNPNGDPYEVYRVIGATNGIDAYSYTNSVVVNQTIIVPQFGHAEGDAAAIAAYEDALPGYKTIGVRSEMLPPLAGGLHCITKEIPLGILKAVELADIGPGADVEDRANHDDLVWVNDGIGDIEVYWTYPDPTITAPAVMAATLGLPVGKGNPDNFIVLWPDLSNVDYLNPYNNIALLGFRSYELLLHRFTNDLILRNALLFPEEPKSGIEQAVYMNSEITVVSIGTLDLSAWNGVSNTPPEIFADAVEQILENLSSIDPGKKIVLTTPFDYAAILIASSGGTPWPADIEEDTYATMYAEIIYEKVAYANSQGMNVAIADFTQLHKDIASGTTIQGIPLNIGTLHLLLYPGTWYFTDLNAALHAYVVINAINEHYGAGLPLPELADYVPAP